MSKLRCPPYGLQQDQRVHALINEYAEWRTPLFPCEFRAWLPALCMQRLRIFKQDRP